MKKSMADRIEEYIKVLIGRSENRQIEIQRSELAETFSCVPSQVTYVLSTRFTIADGYFTESRRGGSGYVRISEHSRDQAILQQCGFNELLTILGRERIISEREEQLVRSLLMAAMRSLPPELKVRVCLDVKRELARISGGAGNSPNLQ